jgi:hypothetical protein
MIVKNLFLEDLKDSNEDEIKKHLAEEYAEESSGFDYGDPSDDTKAALLAELEGFDIIIAYESVGDYGCDSSSWFLLKRKADNELFEVHGSHCSCYGFEGQFKDLEETTLEYLKSDKFNFYCGGYDRNETDNQLAVKEFLKAYGETP